MLKVLETVAPEAQIDTQELPRDRILIEGLVLQAEIGVFDSEQGRTQSVRFDVSVLHEPLRPGREYDMANIVRYDLIVADIKAILAKGHIDLVETLAEEVAAACLAYERAEQVTVQVAKLEAIAEAAAVGVEITRRK